MRRIGVSKGSVAGVVLGALILIVTPASARAGSFTFDSNTNTYTYIGDLFNVCGFGCPENAPADPTGVDFITATLKYAAKLPANLTDASPVPISWTFDDFFHVLNFSGNGLPPDFPGDIEDPPAPGLVLSTDGNGDIISWVMVAFRGGLAPDGLWEGTQAIILNPPIFCGEECGGGGITDFVAVNLRLDREWDAGVVVPGVPEPATLTLLGAGLLAVARRRLRAPRG